jgi:20S proteasome alpha/beta subunit
VTLVVAIKARDGVVLAADGQATTSSANPTRRPAKKLGSLHSRIAYGSAGYGGLTQRVVDRLECELTETDCERPLNELRPRIFKIVNELQQTALDEHVKLANSEPAHVAFLFGGMHEGVPWIYEIGVAGHEEAHEPAAAIGQSHHFAEYGVVHHYHYGLAERDLKQVRMFAFRITANAILTDASGALGAGDIQMYEVRSEGAQELSLDEMKAMAYTLGVWQGRERDIFAEFGIHDGAAQAPADDEVGEGIKL